MDSIVHIETGTLLIVCFICQFIGVCVGLAMRGA